MRIVVIGDGKVGNAIIRHVSREGHQVVVVDKNPNVVEDIVNRYDVMGICGNGASYQILKEADAGRAHVVIAVTASDETNMLACVLAKKLGAKSTIARVRSYEYNDQVKYILRDLDINMVINPEKETADDIMKVINFPEALRVDNFAEGKVDLVELYIPENSPLVGETLISMHQKYQVKVLVCAVQRGEEVYIPNGTFTFKAKDRIHVTAKIMHIKQFLNKLGFMEEKIKSILIIGGGTITSYLGKELIKNKYEVKIIEKDYNRCLELSELLPSATIIHGDGTSHDILSEEGLSDSDIVISLTGQDEENIIISMYAYKQNVKKIVAKVNKESFVGLIESIGMATIVSPKDIIADRIVSYIRARNNSRGSNIVTLYKLVNNKVEALEFIAKPKSKVLNKQLKDIKLKEKVLIAGIIRNGESIIPNGADMIQADDNVIVVTNGQYLDDLDDVLE
jgi:trk system potassium uptake protein TrkA